MNIPSKVLIALGASYVARSWIEIPILVVIVLIVWRFIAKRIEAAESSEMKQVDTLRRASAPVQYGHLRRVK